MVSVIIPNYNHAQYLKQRIDSVLNQTFQDFELIILDDCSTDKSKDVINYYKENEKVSHIVYNNANSGSAFKQWEKGIELAKGEWIWIAESDDYCEENFLESALTNLKGDNTSLIFCQSFSVDESGEVKGDYVWWTESIKSIDWKKPFSMNGKEFIIKTLQFKNIIINASAVVFKKREFDFDKIIKYRTCGDWLFWINVLKTESISYFPKKLNYFRSHFYTTRNLNSEYKIVERIIEELSIKYEIYKSHLITKNQFRRYFSESLNFVLPYSYMYKNVCLRLDLPKSFLLHFWLRKVNLTINRKFFKNN